MNKEISIQWVPSVKGRHSRYSYEMKVIKSNHPKYIAGSRFDFGFFSLATSEGYKIISYPSDKSPKRGKGFVVNS